MLDGLTTAILVDQERMGTDRSTVGTATDANAMLRILFSRLEAAHRPTQRVRLQRRLGHRNRWDHGPARRQDPDQEGDLRRTGGMCERCEGRGSLSDWTSPRCTTTASRSTRVRSRSPATAWTAGTAASSGAMADCDKPIRKFNKRERNDLLYKEPTKIKVEGINLTRLIPT